MNLFKNHVFFSAGIGLIFLLIGLLTLSDYNMMWDARGRFLRGQSYLHYILTGTKTYTKEVSQAYVRYYRDYVSRSSPGRENSFYVPTDSYRKSIYKDPVNGFSYFQNYPGGHPPLSDIGAAIFNIIFYEKLGILKDEVAYSLYPLFLSSILIGVIFLWVKNSYGLFAGIITALSLATYPLFWAESHFNFKDVPLTVFFAISLWTFWKGTVGYSKKWIILSAVFTGCAVGTKFNAVFLPFIIIPWFTIFYWNQNKSERKKYHSWWWLLLIYPFIVFSIFFLTYPYLWENPVKNLLSVFFYYKGLGFDIDYTPRFRTIFNINTYPALWIMITTYPLVLFLSFIGIVFAALKFFKSKDMLISLVLLWFLIPIMRVSMPKSAIYDGVRQIMEFIPAMTILAGIGASHMITWINDYLKLSKKRFSYLTMQLLIVLLFIPLIITFFKIHPAENAYFNSFIGGLPEARLHNITGWGNTDGGIYRVGVTWLNQHAEKNTHIATAFSEPADFYIPDLRNDLIADNDFSGYLQKGEYIIGLTHDSGLEKTYKLHYPSSYLEPVYQYYVDGVPLLKIWKNDKDHIKKEFKNLKNKSTLVIPTKNESSLIWDVGVVKKINYLEIEFNQTNCSALAESIVSLSKDGKSWEILPDSYPGGSISEFGEQPKNGKLIIPIGPLSARFVSISIEPSDACLFHVKKSTIATFE